LKRLKCGRNLVDRSSLPPYLHQHHPSFRLEGGLYSSVPPSLDITIVPLHPSLIPALPPAPSSLMMLASAAMGMRREGERREEEKEEEEKEEEEEEEEELRGWWMRSEEEEEEEEDEEEEEEEKGGRGSMALAKEEANYKYASPALLPSLPPFIPHSLPFFHTPCVDQPCLRPRRGAEGNMGRKEGGKEGGREEGREYVAHFGVPVAGRLLAMEEEEEQEKEKEEEEGEEGKGGGEGGGAGGWEEEVEGEGERKRARLYSPYFGFRR